MDQNRSPWVNLPTSATSVTTSRPLPLRLEPVLWILSLESLVLLLLPPLPFIVVSRWRRSRDREAELKPSQLLRIRSTFVRGRSVSGHGEWKKRKGRGREGRYRNVMRLYKIFSFRRFVRIANFSRYSKL